MSSKVHTMKKDSNPDEGNTENREPSLSRKAISRAVEAIEENLGIELPKEGKLRIKNSVADIDDFPRFWMWTSFTLYQMFFFASAAFFFWYQYVQARTQTFITLQNDSGVCKGESGSKTCCEVPQIVSGTFLADATGNWNTQPQFNYEKNNYGVNTAALSYTNAQWTKVMKGIVSQVQLIGLKGKTRDLAWNMVAWASYTAVGRDNGYLQFYTQGEAGVLFDKPVVAAGFASNVSDSTPCKAKISTSFSGVDHKLTVETDLNIDDSCPNPPCAVNPCPGVLAPQAMGYDTLKASTTKMTWALDMASVTIALSVNMGIVSLKNLVKVAGDNSRIRLLQGLVDSGAMNESTMARTSSYYETLYAPMDLIYCTTYPGTQSASCLVRQGNTLLYPVTTSYGFSDDIKKPPKQCTAKTATTPGTAGFYYCNQMDMNVGFIYYPVPNQNLTELYSQITHRPSKLPTNRPSPGPGKPTLKPTRNPTFRPTTFKPTQQPGTPTHLPTRRPSARPTISSAPSTFKPTFKAGDPTPPPTTVPSRRPSAAPTTATPSVSHRPTARPTTAVPTLTMSPSAKPTTATPTITFVPTKQPNTRRPTVSNKPSRAPSSATPTLTMSPSAAPSTAVPSVNPTFRPTPGPGEPTLPPTVSPTRRPSNSEKPSPLPGDPTETPVVAPTRRPRARLLSIPERPGSDKRRVLVANDEDSAGGEVYAAHHHKKQVINQQNKERDAVADFAAESQNAAEDGSELFNSAVAEGVATKRNHLRGNNKFRTEAANDTYYYYYDDDEVSSNDQDDFQYGDDDYEYQPQDDYTDESSPEDDTSGSDDLYLEFDDDDDDASADDNGDPAFLPTEPPVDLSTLDDEQRQELYEQQNVYSLTDAVIADYVAPDDYELASHDDGFEPLVKPQVTSGLIFEFAYAAALKLNGSTGNGDVYVPNRAYRAMIDTLFGTGDFKRDFSALCSQETFKNGVGFPAGCAMFAVNFFGGDDRKISKYGFQPGTTPAFSNTLYNPRTFLILAKYPPTRLVQPYYECVQGVYQSVYIAASLAFSGTQLAVTIVTLVLMSALFYWLTKVKKLPIKSKTQKEDAIAEEMKARDEKVDAVTAEFHLLKAQHEALLEKFTHLEQDMLHNDKSLSRFQHCVKAANSANKVPVAVQLDQTNNVEPFVHKDSDLAEGDDENNAPLGGDLAKLPDNNTESLADTPIREDHF